MRNPITAFFSLFRHPTVAEELAIAIAKTRREIIQLELEGIKHEHNILQSKKRSSYLEKAYTAAGGNLAHRGIGNYPESIHSAARLARTK